MKVIVVGGWSVILSLPTWICLGHVGASFADVRVLDLGGSVKLKGKHQLCIFHSHYSYKKHQLCARR